MDIVVLDCLLFDVVCISVIEYRISILYSFGDTITRYISNILFAENASLRNLLKKKEQMKIKTKHETLQQL